MSLVGTRVAVAYNLHKCKPGKPRKLGDKCYSVRGVSDRGAPKKLIAYVSEIVLKDPVPLIREGTLDRIRARAEREVCCYIVGTVVSSHSGRLQAAYFNPFKARCFYTADHRCIDAARYVVFDDRGMHVVGAVTSPIRNRAKKMAARNGATAAAIRRFCRIR